MVDIYVHGRGDGTCKVDPDSWQTHARTYEDETGGDSDDLDEVLKHHVLAETGATAMRFHRDYYGDFSYDITGAGPEAVSAVLQRVLQQYAVPKLWRLCLRAATSASWIEYTHVHGRDAAHVLLGIVETLPSES